MTHSQLQAKMRTVIIGLRIKFGMTQIQYAAKLRMNRSNVCNMELGRRRITLNKLVKFIEPFGITLSQFFAMVEKAK